MPVRLAICTLSMLLWVACGEASPGSSDESGIASQNDAGDIDEASFDGGNLDEPDETADPPDGGAQHDGGIVDADGGWSEPDYVPADWPEDGGALRPTSCEKYGPENEGDFEFGYYESPELPDRGGDYLRRVVLVEKESVTASGLLSDPLTTRWFGKYAGSEVQFGVTHTKGWQIPSQLGQVLRLESGGGQVPCHAIGAEPAYVTTTVLRDASGQLLMVSGKASASADSGELMFAREVIPEADLRWVEIGCPEFADSGHGDSAGRYQSRAIGVAIQFPRTGEATHLLHPRERVEIATEQGVYVFALSRAWKWMDHRCGVASWALYRKDFLVGP